MSEDILTTLKIIIVGSSGVGKTSILSQFMNKEFHTHEPTLRAEPFMIKYQINDETVKLALWDTAGQERFHSLPSMLFRDIQGAILVYDVTNYKSFKDLDKWVMELKSYYEGLEEQPVFTLLGNKIDMECREVHRREGVRFAKRHAALFLETSAKTSEGVYTAFDNLVAKILETPGLWKRNEESKSLRLLSMKSSEEDPWYKSCFSWWR